MNTLIELQDVTKEYNGQVVLRGIDLKIARNEFVTFLGPSGCGKTTTLRIIGGFIEPSSGEVLFDGVSILDTPAHKRPTNTVFQRYSLFPHLNVFENVAFGLRVKSEEAISNQSIRKIQDEYNEKIKQTKDKNLHQELRKELKKEVDLLKDPNFYKKEEIAIVTKDTHAKISTITDKHEQNEMKKELNAKVRLIKKTFETRKTREASLEKKVSKYLKMVGLEGYEERSIDRMSGGQQQRVAIARALINEPNVLLLDEPLSALDLKLRQEMQYELKELQRNAGITFIFVTHDQEEALTMSDKIVVMNLGEIQQIGTPEDIYNEPANRFVASFIGESNIVEGTMLDDFLVEFDGLKHACIDKGFSRNEVVDVVIRPEDIDIVPKGTGLYTGIVDSVAFKGVHYEIDVVTKNETRYTIHTTDFAKEGSIVDIDFGAKDIHVMEKW